MNLRVLGAGLAAEIGAAIAIEVDQTPYIPIHDHNGNVVRLLNSNGTLIESYAYSAFGEETAPVNTINPWRFSSKRNLAGYLLFGRRIYNPDLGRWLSPDPTGYDAGPNLYAFVSNNPLTHFDAYGFFEFGTTKASWSEGFSQGCQNLYEVGTSAVQGYGSLLQSASWHSGLNDLQRNLGMAGGYLLEKGTLEGFKPTWQYDGCKYIKMEDRPLFRGNTILYYINGMNCPFPQACIQQEDASKAFGGCRVDLIYNPEKGTSYSILDTVFSKLNINSEASRFTIEKIKCIADEAKSIPNGEAIGIGFSQGGEFLSRGVTALSQADRSFMHTYTLGSANFIGDIGQKSFHNYASNWDPIPMVANVNYLSARFGYVDGVTFLPSTSDKWVDHAMSSDTYKTALSYIVDKVKHKGTNN